MKKMEKMLGLTDEENIEYIRTASLESRAVSHMVRQSCAIRCTHLQEKSRRYIETNGIKVFHVPVKGTSYFIDVLAASEKAAREKAPSAFHEKINRR
jgi:hypothetical protein